MPYILEDEKYRCPLCGERVRWESDCAGYPGTDKTGRQTVMVCVPGCGGADYFECSSKECPWWYREPNNRSTTGWYKYAVGSVDMSVRPEWFDDAAAWRKELEEEDEEPDDDEP